MWFEALTYHNESASPNPRGEKAVCKRLLVFAFKMHYQTETVMAKNDICQSTNHMFEIYIEVI